MPKLTLDDIKASEARVNDDSIYPLFKQEATPTGYPAPSAETALFIRALVQFVAETGMNCLFRSPPAASQEAWSQFLHLEKERETQLLDNILQALRNKRLSPENRLDLISARLTEYGYTV